MLIISIRFFIYHLFSLLSCQMACPNAQTPTLFRLISGHVSFHLGLIFWFCFYTPRKICLFARKCYVCFTTMVYLSFIAHCWLAGCCWVLFLLILDHIGFYILIQFHIVIICWTLFCSVVFVLFVQVVLVISQINIESKLLEM